MQRCPFKLLLTAAVVCVCAELLTSGCITADVAWVETVCVCVSQKERKKESGWGHIKLLWPSHELGETDHPLSRCSSENCKQPSSLPYSDSLSLCVCWSERLNALPPRSPCYILTITWAAKQVCFLFLRFKGSFLAVRNPPRMTLRPDGNGIKNNHRQKVRKTRQETRLTVPFNRKQIALGCPVTQIAGHLCLSGFVRNNWEEVVVSRTGIGFRPYRPLYCSEQALVVKRFRCGCIRREWRRWLRLWLGSDGFGAGGLHRRGGTRGWITVLFGFTERNSAALCTTEREREESLFTLASSVIQLCSAVFSCFLNTISYSYAHVYSHTCTDTTNITLLI